MKLGKETGSLMNAIIANSNFHTPVLGEDVTECMWTDREAWRVTAVTPDGKGATLTRYAPKYVGTGYGDEAYEYTDVNGNPLLDETHTIQIRFRYNAWRTANGKGSKISLAWGRRDEYRDPSF